MIQKQCVVLLSLTILAMLTALTVGIPILELLFGVELGMYKKDLCILMIGGGMMAYGVFLSTVITIIREQIYLLVSYGAAFLAAMLLADQFVKGYGISGAAVLYSILMAILAVILGCVVLIKVRKRMRDVKTS